MKRLLALTWKEFLQLRRDKMTLKMIIMVPVMQTLIFGYAINYDVKHMQTVVLDESRTFESRELVARMEGTGYFDVVKHVDTMKEMQKEIDSAHAMVGLAIDRDFGHDRHRHAPAHAFLIVNASDSTTSSQAMSIMSGISQQMSIQSLARTGNWKYKQMPVDLRVRPWYNPDLRTSRFIIPGLIAIILTFTLIQFTATAIVRERERGTLEQLQVTPATRAELILGKILPFVVVGSFQFTLAVLLMRWLFDIPIMGSVIDLYIVGFLFMAAVLGLGMLISTIAQTQMQASQMSMFFLLPFVFLSGFVFPIAGMPKIFQWLSAIVPAKYFIDVIRGVVLRGSSLVELWKPTTLLAAYTVLIITLAVGRFKKTAA